MPFRYRFQKVLNVKSELRKRAEQDLASAMSEEQRLKDELARLIAEEEQLRNGMSQAAQRGHLTAHEMMINEQYSAALKQQMNRQRRQVALAIQHTSKVKEALQSAMQNEKMWEKDRERRAEQHAYEQLAADQKMMDEMAQAMMNRRQHPQDGRGH